jgi:predicted metal-dependent phosphoesterase TrpH
MIDLHSHSTASDGSLSPAALVAMARGRGLSALALTDHDTVSGLPEAEAAAALPAAVSPASGSAEGGEAAGQPFRFIRGVEIEIGFEPGEFHLLGLDLGPLFAPPGVVVTGVSNPGAAPLLAALEKLGKARDERNRRILGHILDAGIPVTMEEINAAAGGSRPGRPHIAAVLVAHHAAKNRQDAFSRFLAKGRPFYEPKDCLPLEEAIALVKAAGGLAVVAHPLSLFVSWTRLASLMDEWKELGIDGIEAYHPVAKLGQCRRLERMARERGLRVTAGSDYHGAARPERRLGKTSGNITIEDSYLAELAR